MFRLIPTRIHGVIDYLVGGFLLAMPTVFGFATGGPKQWVPIAQGAFAILYSLFTRYELGFFRTIPMPGHLALDIAGGAFLASSPWLFGFSKEVFLPHVVVGTMEIVVPLFTQTRPAQLAPRRASDR